MRVRFDNPGGGDGSARRWPITPLNVLGSVAGMYAVAVGHPVLDLV